MGDAERRRRRLRHHDAGTPDGVDAAGAPDGEGAVGRAPAGAFAEGPTATTAGVHDEDGSRSRRGGRHAEPESSDDGSRSRRGGRHAELESSEPRARRTGAAEEGERGLRGLVGSGSSQVSVTAALRARDAARPSDADLAEAEARVMIVRRNWVPREELPRTGR